MTTIPLEQARRASGVELIRATGIKPQAIRWVWPGWLAQGKLHVLAGAPGTGKTTIALKVGAAITTGGPLPGGYTAPLGDVIVWSGEDDPADTLVPRLMACGADLNRVHFIGDVPDGNRRRSFDPAADMPKLSAAAAALPALCLLIVDPIVSAIAGDSHKNAEVRRGLQPLVDLGAASGAAILGISHFSKGTGGRDPVERVTGSIGFGALARVVWCAAKSAEDCDGPRKLARAKSNIGSDNGGHEYRLTLEVLGPDLVGQGISWGNAIDGSARDILADADDVGEHGSAKTEAADFLRDLLACGPMPAKNVRAEARSAGLAWSTIRRAKDAIGIRSVKSAAGWSWRLPQDAQEAQGAHTNQVGKLEWEGEL